MSEGELRFNGQDTSEDSDGEIADIQVEKYQFDPDDWVRLVKEIGDHMLTTNQRVDVIKRVRLEMEKDQNQSVSEVTKRELDAIEAKPSSAYNENTRELNDQFSKNLSEVLGKDGTPKLVTEKLPLEEQFVKDIDAIAVARKKAEEIAAEEDDESLAA